MYTVKHLIVNDVIWPYNYLKINMELTIMFSLRNLYFHEIISVIWPDNYLKINVELTIKYSLRHLYFHDMRLSV